MIRIIAALLFITGLALPAAASEVGEDGLHKEEWFALTFRDVAEDIAAAKEEGKRLALVFEQRGCIYCAAMHEKILSDPEVAEYIKANYKVVQYNLFGDEEVTDTDGEALSEKQAARKWRVVYTPTIIFLPETVEEAKSVEDIAVATMPGGFGKWTFLNMFRWVKEKGYEGDEHFQKYHARIINELREQGRLVEE